MTAPTHDNEIRIIRLYDAPIALVWDAWTDEEQTRQWWGPRGFTITTHSKDLRPGGSWDYTMHGPDGTDYPNFTRYHIVEERAKLVYDHGASSSGAPPLFRVTALFRDVDGKTELDMTMAFATDEIARQSRVFIKAAGGNSTWDRLGEYLERAVSSAEVFVINRSFRAPIDRVFTMWTTPEHLVSWLPPAGFAMTFQHADIRTGGDAAFTMASSDFSMYARHEYRQVRRPHLLEYVQTFTDAHGTIARHPGVPTWPEANLVTVTFAEEGPAETRVTVRFAVLGAATPEEMATFIAERSGMAQGWSGSFDVLDPLLAAAPPV